MHRLCLCLAFGVSFHFRSPFAGRRLLAFSPCFPRILPLAPLPCVPGVPALSDFAFSILLTLCLCPFSSATLALTRHCLAQMTATGWVHQAEVVGNSTLTALYIIVGIIACVAKWGKTHPPTEMIQRFCSVLILGCLFRALYFGCVTVTECSNVCAMSASAPARAPSYRLVAPGCHVYVLCVPVCQHPRSRVRRRVHATESQNSVAYLVRAIPLASLHSPCIPNR